ncbi:MAG: GatB/YqeY domain-containing protein [Anaerolineales bacterium]|nr:GatB/YqeY domain-containing protein [Anaerolineales bacterium]
MDIKENLREELKDAMRSNDPLRKTTLRMALAEIKNQEIEKKEELSEPEILNILQKEVKARRETIEGAEQADRQDLIAKAEAEIEVLEEFLPQQLSDDELRGLAEDVIKKVGASSMADIGSVMGQLMPQIRGKADGKDANRIVRELLS